MNSDANAWIQLREACHRGTPQRRRKDSRILGGRTLILLISAHPEVLPPHQVSSVACSVGGDQEEAKATKSPPRASPRQRDMENHFLQRLHRSLHQRCMRQESEFCVSPAEPSAGQIPGSSSPSSPRAEAHGAGSSLPHLNSSLKATDSIT